MSAIGRSSVDDAQHPFGLPQHHGCKFGEAAQPLTPGSMRRPRREQVDDRQREATQVRQVLQVALESLGTRRLRILARLLLNLEAVLLGEARQPPMPPAWVAADHCRFDDERFPFPRGAECAIDDRLVIRDRPLGLCSKGRLLVFAVVAALGGRTKELVVRSDERRGALGVGGRHLCE